MRLYRSGDEVCQLCYHAIHRVRWRPDPGAEGGGRAISAGYRCALSGQIVGWDDWCERFRRSFHKSHATEVF